MARASEPRCPSAFASCTDQGFHMTQIFFECFATGGAEAVLGLGHASGEGLRARDIAGVFELARVDADVAVCGAEELFEFIERERTIYGQSADDAETRALVNQPVEVCRRGFGRSRGAPRLLVARNFICCRSSRHISSQSRLRKERGSHRIQFPEKRSANLPEKKAPPRPGR